MNEEENKSIVDSLVKKDNYPYLARTNDLEKTAEELEKQAGKGKEVLKAKDMVRSDHCRIAKARSARQHFKYSWLYFRYSIRMFLAGCLSFPVVLRNLWTKEQTPSMIYCDILYESDKDGGIDLDYHFPVLQNKQRVKKLSIDDTTNKHNVTDTHKKAKIND